MTGPSFDVVVPTVGRPSLRALLAALGAARGPLPGRVILVDDRPAAAGPLDAAPPARLAGKVETVRGPARGPAAARNRGWAGSAADWVAFLDDDVLPRSDWLGRLSADLSGLADDVAGSQGRLEVPLPTDRRPSDWERNVAGLEHARWATADLAYRRDALADVGGFDERFPRAYREDADLGLRLVERGWRIVPGTRRTVHPVRPTDFWVSVRLQAGNADDALMRAVHGRGWRRRAGVPAGRRPRHLATTAAATLAVAGLLSGRRRTALAGAAGWLAGTAEFAWARIAPGPRDAAEVTRMLATSALLPATATWHWLRGLLRARRLVHAEAAGQAGLAARPEAVLFDRDGTLVVDVPYNGDPERVEPVPGARIALDRLRAAGLALAVVSNQSGVARGLLTEAQVAAVNERVEALLGPLGPWCVCPHGPGDGCSCRKPRPGLVLTAATALGVDPRRCVVVGDVGADVAAARAAGARAILVPTVRTRPEEVAEAPEVAADLAEAVDAILDGARRPPRRARDRRAA